MTANEKPPRIFLAASSKDRQFAARLSSAIEEEGGHSYFDDDLGVSAEAWQEQLLERLKDSDMAILILPSREGEGKAALFEIGAAMALGKPVVVVVKDWSSTSSANTSFAKDIAGDRIVDASRKRVQDVARDIVARAPH
jgi:nucleoside 2-deoxyribosyltransferase